MVHSLTNHLRLKVLAQSVGELITENANILRDSDLPGQESTLAVAEFIASLEVLVFDPVLLLISYREAWPILQADQE